MQTLWDQRFAFRTKRMSASAIRELLKFTEQPEVISFAGGLPAPELFPVDDFKRACTAVLDNNSAVALQYGTTEGYLPLRELLIKITLEQGIPVDLSNVIITSGSQQALDLIGKIFINRGDHILVENPSYLGALQAWSAYGAEFVTVPNDENGMCVDRLEEALRAGPKFIYALANFQNPTGNTLSLERRKKLVELADKYGVPIVEDDAYGRLRYEGEPLPTLQYLDSQIREPSSSYSGNVIYMSSFSKILAPGLRLAWIVAPETVINHVNTCKQGADLHSSTFNQVVAYEICRKNFLKEHIELIQKTYRARRNAMLDSLEENMPAGVTWTHPEGGLFLWVETPPSIDTIQLLKKALEQKVAFVPGAYFYANGGGTNTMRLNFSCSNPEVINEGIFRLSKLIKNK